MKYLLNALLIFVTVLAIKYANNVYRVDCVPLGIQMFLVGISIILVTASFFVTFLVLCTSD